MRSQSKRFNELIKEYESLKNELFKNCSFIIVDHDDPKQRRYNQLFMWIFPQFRTCEYIDPLKEIII